MTREEKIEAIKNEFRPYAGDTSEAELHELAEKFYAIAVSVVNQKAA